MIGRRFTSLFILVILTSVEGQHLKQENYLCESSVYAKRYQEFKRCNEKLILLPQLSFCQRSQLAIEKCSLAFGDCHNEEIRQNFINDFKYFQKQTSKIISDDLCPFINDFEPDLKTIFKPTEKCSSEEVQQLEEDFDDCIKSKSGKTLSEHMIYILLAPKHHRKNLACDGMNLYYKQCGETLFPRCYKDDHIVKHIQDNILIFETYYEISLSDC